MKYWTIRLGVQMSSLAISHWLVKNTVFQRIPIEWFDKLSELLRNVRLSKGESDWKNSNIVSFCVFDHGDRISVGSPLEILQVFRYLKG